MSGICNILRVHGFDFTYALLSLALPKAPILASLNCFLLHLTDLKPNLCGCYPYAYTGSLFASNE